MFDKKKELDQTNEAEVKDVVTQELAEADFLRICKAARIKWDMFRQMAGTRDADNDKDLIVSEIMCGGITVNEEGFPTVHTESKALPTVAIFRRPIRADKLMIDRCKEGHNVKAQDAVLGAFLKISPALLQSLEEVDFKKIEALWFLFLGY